MDDQTAALNSLQLAVVVAFLAVALGIVIFMQSGGFLQIAINLAIEDGRVIPGMSRDDVVSSWGSPSQAGGPSIKPMIVALTWTYKGRGQAVHFSSDGIVICVTEYLGD